MSGWDDLFDLAAGVESHETSNTSVGTPLPTRHGAIGSGMSNCKDEDEKTTNNTHSSSRKKQKKNKQKSVLQDDDHHVVYQEILRSRMDPIESQISNWPFWIKLGSSLLGDDHCKQPIFSSRKRHDISSLYHCITVDTDKLQGRTSRRGYTDESFNHLEMFCSIRNIRCCCSSIFHLLIYEDDIQGGAKSFIKKLVFNSLHMAKSLITYHNKLTNRELKNDGEAEILMEKCTTIQSRSQNLMEKAKSQGMNKLMKIFDELVQLIIASDAAYYRLYYLQISGIIHTFQVNDNPVYIPHPPTYFGADCLSWTVYIGNQVREEFEDYMKQCLHGTSSDILPILRRFGFDNNNNNDDQPAGNITKNQKSTMDPLLYLHTNRYMESIFIFWKSGWMHSKNAFMDTQSALERNNNDDDFYNNLETPAPTVLEEWRDSCRDLLCSLYAYATLPQDAIGQVKHIMKDNNITGGIIEIGAGTGYMAKVINDQSNVKYEAFDIAPTALFTPNEYHGSTPSFYSIQKYDKNTLPMMIKSKGETTVSGIALLLAYPPPQSTMAYDTVRAFLKGGGICVIHVGEFSGLTGSQKFEQLLQNNFQLTYRVECRGWGTDIGELTVWLKSSVAKANKKIRPYSPLLLPCSNCRKKESSRQCRIFRSLNYCSSECFEQHQKFRKECFKFSFIPSMYNGEEIQLDFNDSKHFRLI